MNLFSTYQMMDVETLEFIMFLIGFNCTLHKRLCFNVHKYAFKF